MQDFHSAESANSLIRTKSKFTEFDEHHFATRNYHHVEAAISFIATSFPYHATKVSTPF
jgi:hypothetical protein